jgi:transposase
LTAESKALRRRLEVVLLFDEAQGRGRERIEGAIIVRRSAGGRRALEPHQVAALRAGYRAWQAAHSAASEARRWAVLEMLRSGASRAAVAAHFGLTESTVKTYEARARLWPRAPIPPGRDEAIVAMVGAGVPIAEVGRRFDLSWRSVYAVLERRGARGCLKRRRLPRARRAA